MIKVGDNIKFGDIKGEVIRVYAGFFQVSYKICCEIYLLTIGYHQNFEILKEAQTNVK